MEKFITGFDIVYSIIVIGVWFAVSYLLWVGEQDGPVSNAGYIATIGIIIGITLLTLSYLGIRILIGQVDITLLQQLPFVFSVTSGLVSGIPLLCIIAIYRFDIPFILIFILTALPSTLSGYIIHLKTML